MRIVNPRILQIAEEIGRNRPSAEQIAELRSHGYALESTGNSNRIIPVNNTVVRTFYDTGNAENTYRANLPDTRIAGQTEASEQLATSGVFQGDDDPWNDTSPIENPVADQMSFSFEGSNDPTGNSYTPMFTADSGSGGDGGNNNPPRFTDMSPGDASQPINIAGPPRPRSLRERLAEGLLRGFRTGMQPDKSMSSETVMNISTEDGVAKKPTSTRGTPFLRDPADYGRQYKELGLPGVAGYTAGRIAGDVVFNGIPQFFWNIHPAEVTSHVAYDMAKDAGLNRAGRGWTQYAAGLGLGTMAGVFNPLNPTEAFRSPGFSAIVPSDEDPRKPENWAQDMISRWPLMRGGKILPWEQFSQEKPNITQDQYNRYREFLRSPGIGGFGLLKFTTDSVRDPTGLEAQLMGFPITPTGVLAGTLGGIAAVSLARGEVPNRIGISNHYTPKLGFPSDGRQIELDLNTGLNMSDPDTKPIVQPKPDFRYSVGIPEVITKPAGTAVAGARGIVGNLFRRY